MHIYGLRMDHQVDHIIWFKGEIIWCHSKPMMMPQIWLNILVMLQRRSSLLSFEGLVNRGVSKTWFSFGTVVILDVALLLSQTSHILLTQCSV